MLERVIVWLCVQGSVGCVCWGSVSGCVGGVSVDVYVGGSECECVC